MFIQNHIFDQTKNILTIRGSPHVIKYKVFKEVIVTDENRDQVWNITQNESTGTETGLVPLAEQDHDQTSGITTVQLPDDQTVESQQLHLQKVTTTGSVETSKVATTNTLDTRTYTGVWQANPNGALTIVIQETGSPVFTTIPGSLITINSINTQNTVNFDTFLNLLDLWACSGPTCDAPQNVSPFPSNFENITGYGSFAGCNENSARYCFQYLGISFPPPAPFEKCDTCDMINSTRFPEMTEDLYQHGTFTFRCCEPDAQIVAGDTFTFTIDETNAISCGPSCV